MDPVLYFAARSLTDQLPRSHEFLSGTVRCLAQVLSCALVFAPVFFAGIIFALAFRDSQRPDIDLGSNIAGIILGGLSENLSLATGFNSLLVVAILFYLLSALLGSRRPALPLPSPPCAL